MYDLIRDGGFPMFILLALGTWALVVAALAWRRPDRQRMRMARELRFATLCAAGFGIVADLKATGVHAPHFEQPAFDLAHILVQGFAESMSPAIMGLSFAVIVSVFLALAERGLVEA